ncbi:preprotein translocase subunit YajC [Microvirgula aerodenitrificans]|uniref:preprotein translocase subunit YajC n=1 Tax=Microvirgula aerodenitrificans TaxID=57480 RepID=UPI000B28E6CD|nr:preprotein translocase subunit YajC [Microvirgula aerodenitrificans]
MNEQLMSFLPMIVIFILFWFLLVRPQQKKMKEQKAMLEALQKGDEVLTQAGMIGRITKLDGNDVTVEVAKGIEIQFQRAAIGNKLEKGSYKG